ncbi:MAG: F0F1 ATP synthase subunit B [Gemmatimonadota bacterium]|nr:F0F1 ATP synthase subunit B [Gemmatimonadota bacterium]
MRTSRVAASVGVLSLGLPGQAWALAGAGTTPLFTVNLGTTVWTTIVFVALLAILWRFAWGPILSAIESREEGIQSAIDEATARNAEAERLLAEHREQLADARRQANELIAEGKAAGENLRKEIEEKAREEAQALIERARAEIERERDQALDTLRKESVELALAAASRLLEEKLDASKDRELVERYLAELTETEEVSA